jgi:hypothetical protein
MTVHDEPKSWTHEALQDYGFGGFVPFESLATCDVPKGPGVYCVIRPSPGAPKFVAASPAGHFKGKDPTVSRSELQDLWVQGAAVVYIGKANHGVTKRRGLRKRLQEFGDFGAGHPAAHSGGQRIWQLSDSAELLVGWKQLPDEDVVSTERRLLDAFSRRHGRLPFANMR